LHRSISPGSILRYAVGELSTTDDGRPTTDDRNG
jgi:hypothetical protein